MGSGKSTIATHLARLTGIPNIPMDRVRWYYYLKDGFSLEVESKLPSFKERMAYWKPFEVKAVKRIIREFSESIIDFGAGHSYFPDVEQFKEVAETLRPVPNVFLLVPSQDKEKSLVICNQRLAERIGKPLSSDEIQANRNFIEHESNYSLAKQIVYSEGKSREQVAQEVFDRLI
jgi:shikimate kinase